MKKRILSLLAAFALLLAGCGGAPEQPDTAGDGPVRVLATTYPVYLLTTELTAGLEGVETDLLVNSQTSCLHDYTLTVTDMKAIEAADIIVMNGVGMENFMSDALSHSQATVIDASARVELMPLTGHSHSHEEDHDHDHDELEMDPHIWMAPENAAAMLTAIAEGLTAADPVFASVGEALAPAVDRLTQAREELLEQLSVVPADRRELITFHDGFHYFAHSFDLELLRSIEEEEGSEASAGEIREIVSLIEEHHLPAIFTEKKGSTSTADAISRETGCTVAQLDMMMSGDAAGLDGYLDVISGNIHTFLEAVQ